MSTSASQDIAVKFAASACPLIFKFETKDFMSRGADISFLSVRNPPLALSLSLLAASSAHPGSLSFAQVYPTEQEALYPPLTYLRAVEMKKETLGGMEVVVATVEPVFP